jgi:FkbM family methyltransferase
MGALKDIARRYRRRAFEALGSQRYSRFALNGIDEKLKAYINFDSGFFIEAGANDGICQSNTYHLERFRNWTGLLVEAVPEKARACRLNRPGSRTVQSALVADDAIRHVDIRAANLMAYVAGSFDDPDAEATHLRYAKTVQLMEQVPTIQVPARTLSSILDEIRAPMIDFFSLDVEGYEQEVLKGLDLSRHRPAWILVETKRIDAILKLFGGAYQSESQFSPHDYILKSTP